MATLDHLAEVATQLLHQQKVKVYLKEVLWHTKQKCTFVHFGMLCVHKIF